MSGDIVSCVRFAVLGLTRDPPGFARGYEEGQHHTHVDSAHAGAIGILNAVDSPCPKLIFVWMGLASLLVVGLCFSLVL